MHNDNNKYKNHSRFVNNDCLDDKIIIINVKHVIFFSFIPNELRQNQGEKLLVL